MTVTQAQDLLAAARALRTAGSAAMDAAAKAFNLACEMERQAQAVIEAAGRPAPVIPMRSMHLSLVATATPGLSPVLSGADLRDD
ncbi:MAG: hypothetical protein EBZ50_07155 [Alphaproteobacteria bacterium]|nr:hypothetical protein [Alphaproteobacteria bacterium]